MKETILCLTPIDSKVLSVICQSCIGIHSQLECMCLKANATRTGMQTKINKVCSRVIPSMLASLQSSWYWQEKFVPETEWVVNSSCIHCLCPSNPSCVCHLHSRNAEFLHDQWELCTAGHRRDWRLRQGQLPTWATYSKPLHLWDQDKEPA